jgi:hypothetical protein
MEAMAEAHHAKADTKIEACLNQFKEEIKARQNKAAAQADVRLERMEAAMHSIRSDIERTVQQQMGALLEGLKPCGKATTICKVVSEGCPEILKAGLKETEADVIT